MATLVGTQSFMDQKCPVYGAPSARLSLLKGLALRPEAEKSQLCQNMILPELQYTKRLFKKQWPGWTNFYG